MANRKGDTMELNSILAEARSRKSGTPAKSGAGKQSAPARKAAPARVNNFNDNFVITDDDDRPVRPQVKNSRPAPAKQQPKKKKKTGLIVAICIVSILLVAAVGGLTLYLFSGSGTGPDSTFSDNVYVNGRSLKDLTMGQAKTLMKGVEDELADGIKIEVKAGDKSYSYTKDDFNYSFDTDQVLSEAKTYSEEKGIKTEDKNYEITMKVSVPSNMELDKVISQIKILKHVIKVSRV